MRERTQARHREVHLPVSCTSKTIAAAVAVTAYCATCQFTFRTADPPPWEPLKRLRMRATRASGSWNVRLEPRLRQHGRNEVPGGLFAGLNRNAVFFAEDLQHALECAASLSEAVGIVPGPVVLQRSAELVICARIVEVGDHRERREHRFSVRGLLIHTHDARERYAYDIDVARPGSSRVMPGKIWNGAPSRRKLSLSAATN